MQIVEDDERAVHRIYEADGHYLATKAAPAVELRVIFADEDESAFPMERARGLLPSVTSARDTHLE